MSFFDGAENSAAKAVGVPVVLGLGSNTPFLGKEPLDLLRTACRLLSERIADMRCSSVYMTKAMYYRDQCDFHNMVAAGFFDGTPFELLEFIQRIELELGRNRSAEIRRGPRSMDIDIELFADKSVSTEVLQIPHPLIEERAFVLVPMLEILDKNADFIDTIDRDYYRRCLDNIQDAEVRQLPFSPFTLGELST